MMETQAPQPAQATLSVRFVGSGSEYFRIWAVNLLLTLVTLGLYYPFAKTRRLKYFHAATEVGGHALSFHANPWAMLRGYLLVAAMVAVYGVAGHVSPMAGLVAFIIVALLWPALWHSSLRFRLANTGWHGLRFRFTGSRADAYRALAPALALALVVVGVGLWLTPEAPPAPGTPGNQGAAAGLGASLAGLLPPLLMLLAGPWILWRLRRYQHQHYALGDEHSRFEVGAGAFYSLGLRMLGLLLITAVVIGVGVAIVLPLLQGAGRAGASPAAGLALAVGVLLALVLMGLLQVLLWPWVTARLQNLVWNGTRSQNLRMDSQLRYGPLARLTLKNWLLVLLTLGLYWPFAAVASARLRLESVQVLSSVDIDTLLARPEAAGEAAAGEAAGDLLGVDLGL